MEVERARSSTCPPNCEFQTTRTVSFSSASTIEKHEILLRNGIYCFHDTSGYGNSHEHDCVEKLSDFIYGLGSTIFFYENLSQQKIPIVLVVTALEDEDPDMETWWLGNEAVFAKYGMFFHGHVCVTTYKDASQQLPKDALAVDKADQTDVVAISSNEDPNSNEKVTNTVLLSDSNEGELTPSLPTFELNLEISISTPVIGADTLNTPIESSSSPSASTSPLS
ncbi:hypothetical protein GG344DRAFT_76933 [Lentinula edodes]|nr:hypothetical protein GG344DRAFT_76933 [Lentinula edodes]